MGVGVLWVRCVGVWGTVCGSVGVGVGVDFLCVFLLIIFDFFWEFCFFLDFLFSVSFLKKIKKKSKVFKR